MALRPEEARPSHGIIISISAYISKTPRTRLILPVRVVWVLEMNPSRSCGSSGYFIIENGREVSTRQE